MATSMDIECAYSTSPMKTTEPRLSYKISVSNNDHHQRVLQKWMHTVLCYKKQSDSEDNGLHAKGWIKESLGKALLEHPILAGRLRKSENNNGDLNIVSNDSGIRCIDVQISLSLVHFLELSKEKKNEVEGKLLYWKNVDESNPICSPLFYIQMTKFKCGG
ncbi:protein ECERIFERUM 26-like [Chenopodium quinoa]|uniref:protein ECERIFERUM 26-like n=1 Tax=Chenopodium quinoa TaxID=63459 RepID=UPI000B787174|nr:protein ECERIFERUM 26-like [Chenopodium quinoa]